MAGKKWILFIATLFLCYGVFAQELEEQTDAAGYKFVMDANGIPQYTQILAWEGDPYALEYQITVLDDTKKEILYTHQESTMLEITLSPGKYTYNIVTINLLGQAESETGYIPLEIIYAELPEITDVSPGHIFMDSFDSLVTIEGSLLEEGSKIILRKKGDTTKFGIEGVEQSRIDNSELVVEFPMEAYVPGLFDIEVINPGGLSSVKPECLRIMYEHPVDLLFSVGYAPTALMSDTWFTETWNESLYWLGADTSISAYFVKKAWGFLGIELDASVHRWSGGGDTTSISSDFLISGLNFLYRYRINKDFHLLARAGGGVYVSHHSFDFEGTVGPDSYFSGICAQGGLAAQFFLPHDLYLEVGSNWVELFAGESKAGLIRPVLRFGYQIF